MLFQLVFLLFLLFLIFFLTKKISSYVFNLIFFLSRNKNIALWVVHILFLPGTIIHELSHFLVAKILWVPTGKLSIIPKIEEGSRVKTGSLEIGSTDPVRLTLVGLAPLFIGLTLLYTIGTYFFPNFLTLNLSISQLLTFNFELLTFLGLYLLFTISSTMFSSQKDLKPLIIVVPLLILIMATFYIVGLRVTFTQKFLAGLKIITTNLNRYLLLSAVVNGVIYGIMRVGIGIFRKLKTSSG